MSSCYLLALSPRTAEHTLVHINGLAPSRRSTHPSLQVFVAAAPVHFRVLFRVDPERAYATAAWARTAIEAPRVFAFEAPPSSAAIATSILATPACVILCWGVFLCRSLGFTFASVSVGLAVSVGSRSDDTPASTAAKAELAACILAVPALYRLVRSYFSLCIRFSVVHAEASRASA